MNKLRFGLVLCFCSTVFIFCSALKAEDSCLDITKFGIYESTYVNSSYFAKVSFLSKLKGMTKTEADKEFAHTGSANYYGIPLGSTFNTVQYNSFMSSVDKLIDLDAVYSHRETIALYKPNEKIIDAWKECITDKGKRGLFINFEDISKKLVRLAITWKPLDPNDLKPGTYSSPPTVMGATVSEEDKKYLTVGHKIIPNRTKYITLLRNTEEELYVSINIKEGDAKDVWLPPIVEFPPIAIGYEVECNYTAKKEPEIALIKFGEELRFYSDQTSPYGKDHAYCGVTDEGLLYAINDDSAPGAGPTRGGEHMTRATSTFEEHPHYTIVECVKLRVIYEEDIFKK